MVEKLRTDSIFPRRLLRWQLGQSLRGAWGEEFESLGFVRHGLLHVQALESGVTVLDEPIGGIPRWPFLGSCAVAVAGAIAGCEVGYC